MKFREQAPEEPGYYWARYAHWPKPEPFEYLTGSYPKALRIGAVHWFDPSDLLWGDRIEVPQVEDGA